MRRAKVVFRRLIVFSNPCQRCSNKLNAVST
jgi:hypothetical protein